MRGLTEVVSAAALLHDIGHVPFCHTLEDEFAGLYPRHDRLGGPRLYHMLFSESSELASVFSNSRGRWLDKLSNSDLRQLIYVILSWKEEIKDPKSPKDFQTLLSDELDKPDLDQGYRHRLLNLKSWHARFVEENVFHPFMSDIVGNTICADLLDYLPRDRQNPD